MKFKRSRYTRLVAPFSRTSPSPFTFLDPANYSSRQPIYPIPRRLDTSHRCPSFICNAAAVSPRHPTSPFLDLTLDTADSLSLSLSPREHQSFHVSASLKRTRRRIRRFQSLSNSNSIVLFSFQQDLSCCLPTFLFLFLFHTNVTFAYSRIFLNRILR